MDRIEGKVLHTDESFGRRFRLGSNRNFRAVYRKGKSTPSKNLTLIYTKGSDQRFGFSVSAKVGNAVTRSRLRRWMKEDIRRMRQTLKCGRYVFIARPSMKTQPHDELTGELRSVLKRAKLIREP